MKVFQRMVFIYGATFIRRWRQTQVWLQNIVCFQLVSLKSYEYLDNKTNESGQIWFIQNVQQDISTIKWLIKLCWEVLNCELDLPNLLRDCKPTFYEKAFSKDGLRYANKSGQQNKINEVYCAAIRKCLMVTNRFNRCFTITLTANIILKRF